MGTLYLVFTLVGAFAWGHFLTHLWTGVLDPAFHFLFAVTALDEDGNESEFSDPLPAEVGP